MRICPSVYDPLAQLAEQLPFKQWVWSSNLQRVTKKRGVPWVSLSFYAVEIQKFKSNLPGAGWRRNISNLNIILIQLLFPDPFLSNWFR